MVLNLSQCNFSLSSEWVKWHCEGSRGTCVSAEPAWNHCLICELLYIWKQLESYAATFPVTRPSEMLSSPLCHHEHTWGAGQNFKSTVIFHKDLISFTVNGLRVLEPIQVVFGHKAAYTLDGSLSSHKKAVVINTRKITYKYTVAVH